jgi:spore coat polysaccharide biosynthesis protein SpsF
MKIVTVVQARCSSSRLPNKVLLPILGKELLIRQLERISHSYLAGKIVVATSTDSSDDKIENLCKENNYTCFRGSLNDLLDRHYQAAKLFEADAVVKIPSDCPLIDPRIIDNVIDFFIKNNDKYDYVSNLHPATYPDGNDVEIMHSSVLEKAWKEAKKDFEREHTTPYIWENPAIFRIGNVEWETGKDYSMTHRFTIDYQEDYEFILRIYEKLYPITPYFSLQNIFDLLKSEPELLKINEKYAGVNWYRNHLDELKTIAPNQTKII